MTTTLSATPRVTRHLVRFASLITLITALGTAGYTFIEGWTLADALYMTVITLSTVGYGEVAPLSPTGRLFSTGLIISGVGAVAYLFSALSQYIISGELTGSIRIRRMQRRIDALSGHYIICGFGRVGKQVELDLRERGVECVVVDRDREVFAGTDGTTLSTAQDASTDEALHAAGIERASGLVAATGDDATNLFITITARSLNEKLVVVACANQPTSEAKFMRAGASHIISPYTISGRRIATQLLYPYVTDFLDVVMHTGQLELWLEECTIASDSFMHGKTIAEAGVRQRTGANLGTRAQLESLGALSLESAKGVTSEMATRIGQVRFLLLAAIGLAIAAPAAAQQGDLERPAAVTDSAIVRGEEVFSGPANRVACHGQEASGTERAPI